MPRSCEVDRRMAVERAKGRCNPDEAKSLVRAQMNASLHPDAVAEELVDDICEQLLDDIGPFLRVVTNDLVVGRSTPRDRFRLLRSLTKTALDFLAKHVDASDSENSPVESAVDG